MHPKVFSTRITRLFGITHPILCGGLMWLSDASYVAGIVNAGGMGFITPRSFASLDAFGIELDKCRSLTGGKAFGVNLSVSRQRQSNADLDAWLDMSLEAGVRHFETAGDAPGDLIARIHAAGAIVMHKCTRLRHALAAERAGVDAIALVGMEAGGHPGSNPLPSMVLGAQAVGQLKVPFAIGGGIGTGRQLLAALALGADAVLMGSRFVASEECWAHENYKKRVVSSDAFASVTAFGNNTKLGGTWRVLENETVREVRRREAAGKTEFADFADLIRGQNARDLCYAQGDVEKGMLSLGPAAVFVDSIKAISDIVDEILADAKNSMNRLDKLRTARVFDSAGFFSAISDAADQ